MKDLAYYEVLMMAVPVLLMFVALYFLFRQFFNNQLKLQMMNRTADTGELRVRLKLQAYERLMLFCERIDLQNMIMRLEYDNMSARDLESALIMSVQKEYEYNLSQQLYVSEQLWQIISLAKDQIIEVISHIASRAGPQSSAKDLSGALYKFNKSQKKNPLETAKAAIKKESGLVL